MFKYTPPWQVLCNSLEHGSKRQSSHVCNSQDVHLPGKGRILSHTSKPKVSQVPDHTLSKITMGSTPKLWVMNSLAPQLEKSNLQPMLSTDIKTSSSENSYRHYQNRSPHALSLDNISADQVQSRMTVSSVNGEGDRDVVVHARQIAVFEESSTSEDWQPSPPSSPGSASSADSHTGFYSFVDDLGSPQAKRNEAYMVSPERMSKMSTLKEKNRFKLQTYTEERKPEKLFKETNGDSHYQVQDTLAEDNDEEMPDRVEIIRSQAPKKNFKEQRSALENLELNKSSQSLIDGFSLCYSNVSTKRSLSEADPATIDNQQIDFSAARKQFLMMERSKQNSVSYSSQPEGHSPKLQERSLSAKAVHFTTEDKNKNIKDEFSQNQSNWKRKMEEMSTKMTISDDSKDRIQSNLKDNVDVEKGHQAVGTTRDLSLFIEPSINEMSSSAPVAIMSETPIEKEIRISQEREEDLRRSRGLFHPGPLEMVEIKTKPILSLSPPQSKSVKAKDSNRMSLLIQREIERENRISGLYKKGALNYVGEKMRSAASLSDKMNNTSLNTSINSTGKSVTVEEAIIEEPPVLVENRSEPEKSLSHCCPDRHQDESVTYKKNNAVAEIQNYSVKNTNPPPWINKATESKGISTSINFTAEHLRRSRSIPAWRSNLESSNERPLMLNASENIRREIEEDLRREQELLELRETGKQSVSMETDINTSGLTMSSFIASGKFSDKNNNGHNSLHSFQENLIEDETVFVDKSAPSNQSCCLNTDTTPVARISVPGSRPRLPSVSILTAQPWSGPKPISPAVLRAIPNLPSSPLTETSVPFKGLTEMLLEDFEEKRMKMKDEESSYAGIHLVDDINNEVVEVTRVTRHKNPRAVRWEAGVYANDDTS